MDEMMRKVRLGAILLLPLLAGCRQGPAVEALPEASETLEAVGRRLSGSMSEAKLTTLATRGPAVLGVLTGPERDALGRGYLRFHAAVPVIVDVAVPSRSVPFWIGEQGFAPAGATLENEDAHWAVFRKEFPSGWVGLGVNGMDRKPPAHYVAFLRPARGQVSLRLTDIRLREGDSADWSLVPALPGASAARDVHRPFRVLPLPLFGSLLLQPSHDRRHESVLASGRVWKTHVPSGNRPDQVAIAYGSDPARELVWTWRTGPDSWESAIRIVPARWESAESKSHGDPDLMGMRLVEGTSETVRCPDVLNDPTILRHSVKVDGLSPDTTYLYSVGDSSTSIWGPWRTVKTGRDRPGRVEFLYLGDAQTGLEAWGQRLMRAFRRHPGIDFILLAGDLVDRGNERTNWDHFFLRAGEAFERIPFLPAAGNHEYLDRGPRLYRAFFDLPANGPAGVESDLVYHFETAGAFFAVLDSTLAVSSPTEAGRQARWLDAALAETRATWKFVMFHHPVYSSHPRRDNALLREYWVPVFDRHHVDLVLQGHDHAYLRTYPMRANRPVGTPAEGTIYIVSVSGDKFSDQTLRDYAEAGFEKTSTYQTIEIDSARDLLTYRAWNDDGEVVDRLEIAGPRADPSYTVLRDAAGKDFEPGHPASRSLHER
jgi:hypothetical protein